jgi:predicted Zn-dependent protease
MRGIILDAALALACATNPVTGKKQLVLISEAQEIELNREADKDITASISLYPNEKLQQYVQALSARLAATTKRPKLP